MTATSQRLALAWPLLIFLLFPSLTRAETAVQAWVQRYNGPTSDVGQATAVAVDGSNNVIVTGPSAGGNGLPDYVTIKYSNIGVALWTNRYNGPADWDDTAYAVVADDNNDVIVTGGFSYIGSGTSDYATIKYSSSGMPLWTNCYNGPLNGDDGARAAALDRNNDVVVTGVSQGSESSTADYATIKYSSGGEPLWTNRYNGPSNEIDSACAVAVDGNNDVIVTGWSTGSGTYDFDYATIKYSSAGVPLWTNRYNGPGNGEDGAYAVAVDSSNNVIVTGWSIGSGSTNDYATIKYSSAGAGLWTNRYNGPGNRDDQARALSVDRTGNVIVAGYSVGSTSGNDFATVKYICVPKPVMTGLQLTNGTFQMRVDDVLQPGTLVIEAATYPAANPPDWLPVFTNTTPTNILFYTDPEAATNPTRFYRAFQFP